MGPGISLIKLAGADSTSSARVEFPDLVIATDPSRKTKAVLGFDLDPKRANSTGILVYCQMAGTAILRFMLDATNGSAYRAALDETTSTARG